MDRDRQLLFGVLAVQFEQLTAPQFVHAAGHWAADPSTDLADVLVNEGILEPADRTFVDDMVRKIVDEHDGDTSAALATLGGEETVAATSNGLIRLSESGLSVTTPGLPVAAPEYAQVALHESSEFRTPPTRESGNWAPTALLSVGIILLLLVGGIVFGNTERARRDANAAQESATERRDQAERARAQAVRELDDALAARDAAQAELAAETKARARVESQLTFALRTTETFTDELKTRFRNVPEARSGLRALLESNASLLDRIIEMERDPIARDRKRFLQNISLGALYYDLGDYPDSIDAYERAVAASADFAPALTQDAELSVAIADAYAHLAGSYRAAGVIDNAVNAYQTAIVRFERAIATDGATPARSLAIANAHNGLANALLQRGTIAGTIDAYRRSLDEHRTLLEANILTAGINQGLPFEEALTLCEESIALLSAMDAEDPERQYAMAIALDNFGVACGNAGVYEVAETTFAKSLGLFQEIFDLSAQHANLVEDLADVSRDLGLMRSVRGEYASAYEAFDIGLDLIRALANTEPEALELREQLAAFHYTVGSLHLSLRENGEALTSYREMLASYKCEAAREMILSTPTGSLHELYNNAINALRHSADGGESLSLQAAYVALLRYFVESAPNDTLARDALAKAHVEHGVVLRRAGNDIEAVTSFQSALKNLQTLLERDADNADLKTRVAAVQRRIARTGDSP